jgi:hypothetical protein
MSDGIVVPVMSYKTFNFYGLLSPATEDIIIADQIPVTPYAKIGLSLRQHRKNIASGASFIFVLRGVNPSDEDGADFVATTTIGTTAAISGTGGAALLEFTAASGLGTNGPHPMARLVMTVTGASALGFILGIFSADIVLRPST